MFKRLIVALGFVLLFAFAAQTARGDDPPGAKLYATYCAACHGAGGKNGIAPAIGDAKYLSSTTDDAIAQITGDGVVAKGMPAWSKAKGGLLSDAQIADIVTYLRAFASGTPSAPAPIVAPSVADADYAQTKMTITQSTNAAGDAVVSAKLQKNDGSPIGGAPITFGRVTTFGVVDLGIVKTDNSGIASLVLGAVPEAARIVDANFKGAINLGSSAGKIVLQPLAVASSSGHLNLSGVRVSVEDEPLLPPEGSLITPNPPLVPTLLFALVVGCIWATYGFVVSQVVGIWKSGQKRGRENVLTMKAR